MKDEGVSPCTCPYCGQPARVTTGDYIYPNRKDLAHKFFHVCWPCEAYCGSHPGTRTPLGTLANAELRRARNAAHAAFDPIWKRRSCSRSRAYSWLAQKLNIEKRDCHIGQFNEKQCVEVLQACANRSDK